MVDDGRGLAERRTGRHRLPRRTGAEQEQRDGDEDEQEQREEDAASASGHGRRLPQRQSGVARKPVRRVTRHDGWLARNRTWFLPYASALLVVVIEVVAAFTKPLPESAHLVLAAFWGFAVQRGRRRAATAAKIHARLDEYAARHHLPPEYVRDEFDAFRLSLMQAPRSTTGDDHDDE